MCARAHLQGSAMSRIVLHVRVSEAPTSPIAQSSEAFAGITMVSSHFGSVIETPVSDQILHPEEAESRRIAPKTKNLDSGDIIAFPGVAGSSAPPTPLSNPGTLSSCPSCRLHAGPVESLVEPRFKLMLTRCWSPACGSTIGGVWLGSALSAIVSIRIGQFLSHLHRPSEGIQASCESAMPPHTAIPQVPIPTPRTVSQAR